MPYLNWRDLGEQELQKSVTATPGPHGGSPEQVTLKLLLDGERQQLLRAFIEEVHSSQVEGRIEMPGEWRIFFKPREGESRILVAHPDSNQWVATVMLAPQDAQRLLASFGADSNQRRLSDFLALNSRTSNGDLVLGHLTRETVLVVEDTAPMRELLLQLVSGLPGSIHAVGVSSGAELRIELRKNRPTWVLLDEVLPGESAAELGAYLAEEGIPYALVTATSDRNAPLPAGCQARLQKPDWDSLVQIAADWAHWWELARNRSQ